MKIKYQETKEKEFPSMKDFKHNHPEAKILKVDGKKPIEHCECCGIPLFEGDKAHGWNNGEYTCMDCSVGYYGWHKAEVIRGYF